jgi:hypothetical protein
MATVYDSDDTLRAEARFFLTMALVMAATIVAGFSMNLAMGRSSFAVPLLVHVHAFFFFGWIALYLTQNALVARDNVAVHRKLGWLAVLWVPAMLVLGVEMVLFSLRDHGGPPFFNKSEFLWGNVLQLLAFVGLVGAALVTRRNTGWHRRYMLTGMALLTGPGFGRLLPMPLFIPHAWWVGFAVTLVFPLIGMLADRKRHGRVHPAWFWAVGAAVAAHLLSEVIAYSDWGEAMTGSLLAGTPGAARQMDAFMP